MSAENISFPMNFFPETNLVGRFVDGKRYHDTKSNAEFAKDLVENGTPQNLKLAENVIGQLLRCQELNEKNIHYGNFLWEIEDQIIEDLNAVQFVLFNLIIGLKEIENIDVSPSYTNIAVLDIVNSCLGGELLKDERIAQRGYQKLILWMDHVNSSGIPYEYNSPPYISISIEALKILTDLVKDKKTKVRAYTMIARLGLSVALHIHNATGRWAGPFGRAYYPTIICDDVQEAYLFIKGSIPEIKNVRSWLQHNILPYWVKDILENHPKTMCVNETVDVYNNIGISTYHSPSFAMGIASKDLDNQANRYINKQSNVFTVHYSKRGKKEAGVIFSRYLMNNQWIGKYRTTPSRSYYQIFPEEGKFFGIQSGPRAICLYSPHDLGALEKCSSAKGTIIWKKKDFINKVWVGGKEISKFPKEVKHEDVIVVESGDIYTAIIPLKPTNLGTETLLRLVEKDDFLVLESYNYLGVQKTFWEAAWPGAFFQGNPKCGFYIEVSEREAYKDGKLFGEIVKSGELIDREEKPFTWDGEQKRLWTIEYKRDRYIVGIEIDLMAWGLERRWNEEGPLSWSMLDSPLAKETKNGQVDLGSSKFIYGQGVGWLCANKTKNLWIAAHYTPHSSEVKLIVPHGEVIVDQMGTGMIIWDNGNVKVIGIDLKSPPRVIGGNITNNYIVDEMGGME